MVNRGISFFIPYFNCSLIAVITLPATNNGILGVFEHHTIEMNIRIAENIGSFMCEMVSETVYPLMIS